MCVCVCVCVCVNVCVYVCIEKDEINKINWEVHRSFMYIVEWGMIFLKRMKNS